jgi:TonB family protein
MYQGNSKTVTYSIIASASFHALLFGLYFYFVLLRPETRNVVLSNVDLIMQEKEQQVKAPQNKTLSFLKMALPSIPKIAAPVAPRMAQIDIKTPDRRRPAFDLPKSLSERSGRVTAAQKLEMDANRRVDGGIKDAGLDIKADRSAQAMAPRIELEEVGMKKAPAMPKGLKFEDAGPTVRPQTMQELNLAVDNARRSAAAPQALSERQGSVAAARQAPAIAAAPQRLTEARSAGVQVAARAQPSISAGTLSLRHNEALRAADAPAQRLEITGPLSRRKVLKYYAPPFPDWARDRGILEAAVSIKFYVDNSGRVLDNTSVERTSGYGALDRLAADAIKRWAFEPITGAVSKQWGVITFRFLSD